MREGLGAINLLQASSEALLLSNCTVLLEAPMFVVTSTGLGDGR
jgi:hypothetical protein